MALAFPQPKAKTVSPTQKKSDRVAILSKNLKAEDLDMLNAEVSDEAKNFNHEYSGIK